MVLHARSLTANVRTWLATTRRPRILHIFDPACNLINERGEVLSVVTPRIGNGPFNLVLAAEICFSDFLEIEASILISPARLALGDLIVEHVNAELWNPRPDWANLHAEKSNFLNHLPIANYQPLLPQTLVSNLSSALAGADITSAKTIASQIAGLGIGLTPSGDDFLMGAIHAAWILHPADVAADLVKEIVNTAAPLTTSLSAAWLRSAGKGEAEGVRHL